MDVSLTSIAAYSYALVAVSFLVLGAPLALRQRRRHDVALGLACLSSVLWGAALAWDAAQGAKPSALADCAELLRNAGWSAFLLVLRGHFTDAESRLPLRLQPALLLGALVYLACLGAALGGWWNLAQLGHAGALPGAARVAIAVSGMLLVEHVYRARTLHERWAVKFACLGIGAMFAYDFYLYSNAMLFREVDSDIWAARGVINALTVPLIAVSLGRSKLWSSPLAVSRRAMFHSATLFGSALYLLAMGSAGYYLRYFGGSWGTVMQVTFLFGALILLAGVLFSGSFRARLKVFISKHFYRYNYDYREEWMRFTRTLSKPGPDLGERVIEAVATLVESPGGVLWQRGAQGNYEAVTAWHSPALSAVEAADSPFCQFLETSQWVVDLHEYAQTPGKYDALELPGWLRDYPRAWLVVPLILHGRLSGFVLLQNARSPVKLNWEVIDLLEIAGSQAASQLAQQESAHALMVARQFESFNRMSTFVVHDLKNLVLQLSLMNANAAKHKDNPEFQADMLETVDYSVQKMKIMLQKLSRSENAEQPLALAVEQVVRQAVAQKAAFEPRPQLLVESPALQVLADRERLERVLGHLIQNAIEATPRTGRVTIRLSGDEDGHAVVEITDTGEGMSEEFIRERLFTPFDSTKSAGMGIGPFESREYINELGGRLDVRSSPGTGTSFRVVLPLHPQETPAAERAA